MLKNNVSISKAMPIAIAVIFLSAILGVTFYYLSFKKSAPAAVAPAPAQTPNTIPAPAPDETVDWNVYRNEEYGFELKYPNLLFIPKQKESTIILRSFSNTDIEASPVSDLAISIENIKTSPYEDALNYIKNLPTYLEGIGPYEKNIDGTLVYVSTIKLYEGGEGISRNYYFPKFVLIFAYANNNAENKFKDTEDKILFTFKFTEKDETAKTYTLDCTNEPEKFQSKYSWYDHFKEQIIENWSLDYICYNVELNKVVYFKSRRDNEIKLNNLSQLDIYDIKTIESIKIFEINIDSFWEGGTIKEWLKNGDITYECVSVYPGAVFKNTYLYNTQTKDNKIIENCGIGNIDPKYTKKCEE